MQQERSAGRSRVIKRALTRSMPNVLCLAIRWRVAVTAIGPTSSYNTRVVALQLLQGKSDSPSSSNDKSTYVKSSVALAAKAALGASLAPQPQNKEVFAFLAGGGFSASSDDVWQSLMDVFSDHDLQKEFSDKVKEETAKALNEDHKRISVDAARQLALRDVINAHRKLFPEEEFSFSVTPSRYGDIPPPPVTIASVSNMAAEIFKGEIAQKQADYDAAAAADEVQPDKDGAKLDAMEQAVSVLTMNGAADVDQGVTDAKAAYAILTKKLYPDYTDETSGAAATTTAAEPQKKGTTDNAVPA